MATSRVIATTISRSAPTRSWRDVADRVDTTDNYGVNVGYRLKRQTRAGVGLSYWTRDSTGLDFRNYNGLRFGLTMNQEF